MRDHILQYRISNAIGHALYRQMSSRRKDHHAHIHLRVLLLQMQEKLHRSKMRVAQKEENARQTWTPQDPQEVQEASEADETKQAVMISHQMLLRCHTLWVECVRSDSKRIKKNLSQPLVKKADDRLLSLDYNAAAEIFMPSLETLTKYDKGNTTNDGRG